MGRKVLVIGSGLAGTLLANSLRGKNEVTVLEAGRAGGYHYPHVTYLKREFGNVKTFCHGEGGTTNLWHNGLIPLRPEDVQHAQFGELLREAVAYSDRAAESLNFPTPHFSSDYRTLLGRMGEINDRLGLFANGIDCLLYPKSYSALRIGSGVQAHFQVQDIQFTAKGGSIETVNFVTGTQRHTLNPDAVVIAAGSIGTPPLVAKVLSALGHPADGAGKGLMDHPMGFVGKVRVSPKMAPWFRELSLLDCGSYECCTAGRLKCSGYLAAVYFRPALTMTNQLSLYKYKSLLGASRGRQRIKTALSPRLFHPDVLAEIYSHLLHTTVKSNTFGVLVFFEQKRGSGFVAPEGDGPIVSWDISPAELDIYNDMLMQLHQALAHVVEDVVIEAPIDGGWLWSGAHHSGSISLGVESDDVVDTDLKVRNSDNVYVCDASIIQEHSYANTGLTIGQLALRLAATLE